MNEIARGVDVVVVAGTRLSHVDGERGEVLIAGFPVDELAPSATFEEVLYLLWHDRPPCNAEAQELRRTLASQRALPAATVTLLRSAAERELPVMDALRIAV